MPSPRPEAGPLPNQRPEAGPLSTISALKLGVLQMSALKLGRYSNQRPEAGRYSNQRPEAGPTQISALKLGPFQISALKLGSCQKCALKLGPSELGLVNSGPPHLRGTEISLRKIGAVKVRTAEQGESKIAVAQRYAHLVLLVSFIRDQIRVFHNENAIRREPSKRENRHGESHPTASGVRSHKKRTIGFSSFCSS